jgi:hypothetical protein
VVNNGNKGVGSTTATKKEPILILNCHQASTASETEQEKLSILFSHLIAAASFIDRLLTASHIPFAVMGGFAMLCRGSHRTTLDVDVAVK